MVNDISRFETSLSCTAADFEKIAPGWENCVKNCARDTPSLSPRGVRKNGQKLCASPILCAKCFCAKVVRTQFSHNFGERWLRGPESASAQVLRISLESQAVRAINVSTQDSCSVSLHKSYVMRLGHCITYFSQMIICVPLHTKGLPNRTLLFLNYFRQFLFCACRTELFQRKTKGGANSGEGKTYHKSPPQKRFWTPPTYDTISPPPCSGNVILLRGNGHRPDKSHFLRPPKLVLEGVLYGTFFPPPKIARYVLPPPPFANSQLYLPL